MDLNDGKVSACYIKQYNINYVWILKTLGYTVYHEQSQNNNTKRYKITKELKWILKTNSNYPKDNKRRQEEKQVTNRKYIIKW